MIRAASSAPPQWLAMGKRRALGQALRSGYNEGRGVQQRRLDQLCMEILYRLGYIRWKRRRVVETEMRRWRAGDCVACGDIQKPWDRRE